MQRERVMAITARGLMFVVAMAILAGCDPAATPEENVLTLVSKAADSFGCEGCVPDDEPGEGEGEPGEEMTVNLPGGVPMVLVHIPAGTFMMGDSPQHEVTLTQDFYLGKYPVTKRQWQAVMGTTPWAGERYVGDEPNSPAEYVSWDDAQSFMSALNTHIAATGQGAARFRLPTEAEWEYACRAGTTTRFYWGDDRSHEQIDDYAWYWGNAGSVGNNHVHAVGLKLPNPWNLYDMSGNVWEWCEDWYGPYPTGSVTDPVGPSTGTFRTNRGGRWNTFARFCTSAARSLSGAPDTRTYGTGFRVVRQ